MGLLYMAQQAPDVGNPSMNALLGAQQSAPRRGELQTRAHTGTDTEMLASHTEQLANSWMLLFRVAQTRFYVGGQGKEGAFVPHCLCLT